MKELLKSRAKRGIEKKPTTKISFTILKTAIKEANESPRFVEKAAKQLRKSMKNLRKSMKNRSHQKRSSLIPREKQSESPPSATRTTTL